MKSARHWGKIGLRSHHGICVPLSAIGTFLDLMALIDWCKSVHLDCIQLLPLNDTGGDPSPYNPISSCALDPKYLSPNDPLDMNGYDAFVKENGWLSAYSRFKEQRDGSQNHAITQFHCFTQMERVRKHADLQGVYLMGDLPISVSPDSADVWEEPSLFRTDLEAGSPPDVFDPSGQHWGFPLFHWDAMGQQGYAWWKRRLQVMERFFHIYRIDHVVGLFRMWAIPRGRKVAEGSFIPAPGKKLLEMMLDASSMLPIAEDLGTIPKEVNPILKELGICSTKVVRWQKNIPLNEYEPFSLTTLSTPDTEPLALWWTNTPSESVPFAAFMKLPYHPILSFQNRLAILRAAHHSGSFFHINLLQEILALFPELIWQSERINIPGTVSPTNWTYRLRPSIAELVNHEGLKGALREIIT